MPAFLKAFGKAEALLIKEAHPNEDIFTGCRGKLRMAISSRFSNGVATQAHSPLYSNSRQYLMMTPVESALLDDCSIAMALVGDDCIDLVTTWQ